MLRKPLLALLLALGLAVFFVFGVAHLFSLRFETGDVYPPYSSLRADPVGTKALAEALDELPGVTVRRNFKPLPRLRDSGPVTLIYTGVSHHSYWTEQELAAFDALMVSGSRAIFTFYPVERTESAIQERIREDEERAKKKEKVEEEKAGSKKKKNSDRKKKADKKAEEKDSKNEKEDAAGESLVKFNTVARRWGFEFGYLPEEKKAYDRRAALVEPGGRLESDLTWHSSLYFRDLKPQWKALYMSGTMPVVIERSYGKGSIVLVADSYFISNEALRTERHPKLLARLFSGPPAIIFDEESHGLREDPGIASLIRKYRLHGVVFGLVILAICFVWKNTVRFIPAYEPQFTESDVIAGKESTEGFINLLRRSISPTAIFETCVAEWRKAFSHHPRELAKVDLHTAGQPRGNPVAAYRSVAQALTRKK